MREKLLSMNYSSEFKYLHLFKRYSPPKFEVVQNQAKLCMFVATTFFGDGPRNFGSAL